MTTKQIAEAVGKAEKTVRTWAAKVAAKSAGAGAKLAEAQKSGGKPVDWNLDETVAIIAHGMGRNAADLYRMSAKQPTENLYPAIPQNETDLDAAFKAAIIGISAMVNRLDSRMTNIETKIEQRQALLPAPQVKPRDNVSRIVRKYAHDNGLEHGTAWGELYREFGYRTNSNPRTAASNRKMAVIDYIETEGMMGLLESIAIDWGK